MKKILNSQILMLSLIALFFVISCGEEPKILEQFPTVSLNSDDSYLLDVGETFEMDFSAEKGDFQLKVLSILEEGELLSVDRFLIDGMPVTENPITLSGADLDNITNRKVTITAHLVGAEKYLYQVRVEDTNQLTDAVIVDVETNPVPPDLIANSSLMFAEFQGVQTPLNITTIMGTAELSTLAVFENGIAMDTSRLAWKESSLTFDKNPLNLEGDDTDGFEDENLYITTPQAAGQMIYKIKVTDQLAAIDSVIFTVNVQ